LDILGSIGDRAALMMDSVLAVTVIWTVGFMVVWATYFCAAITLLAHGVNGNTKMFDGKGSDVIGASFGETGPPVDALQVNDVAHACVPFFES